MVLESLYPTYRGQENQITKRVIKLFQWSRQKQHTTHVAEKDVKGSCVDWRPLSSPPASQHGKNNTSKAVNNCASRVAQAADQNIPQMDQLFWGPAGVGGGRVVTDA